MSDKQTVVEVDQLSVSYDKTSVLWDLSFAVPRNKIVAIVGPNGAGKSTLLKTILGIIKPISGKVSFFGNNPLSKVFKKIAYVPQKDSIDWDFPITAFEVVLMGRYNHLGRFKRVRQADKEAAMQALELVGMKELAHRQIAQLSGGQQQKLFIARALVQDPDIFLMDEPFTGIDMHSEKTIVHILQELRHNGKTIFVVHHDLNTVEKYFDWIVMLNICLIAHGDIKTTFTHENIQKCFGKRSVLFEEASKLSKEHLEGIIK